MLGMSNTATKVSLPWITTRELGPYRFLGRLRDLEGETSKALCFAGTWYPRSQMAHVDGLDGMEFWVRRWVKPNVIAERTRRRTPV